MDLEAHIEERKAEKRRAVDAVKRAIARIEKAKREPDLWERVFLAEAINQIFRGLYGLAPVSVDMALTIPTDRSDRSKLPDDPLYDRCNIALLQKALDEAKAEPVRRFAHFGPIVFASDEVRS